MAQVRSRRRRRRRLWTLGIVLALLLALMTYLIPRLAGCFSPPLDVTVMLRNTGSVALGGLSLDQEDGSGHALVPTIAPGGTVQVRLVSDDAFGESSIDLVDDATGHNYGLPPWYFENSLHGTIDIEAARVAPGAKLVGRARCATDYIGGRQGWSKLTR